jgi:hypothetical protein
MVAGFLFQINCNVPLWSCIWGDLGIDFLCREDFSLVKSQPLRLTSSSGRRRSGGVGYLITPSCPQVTHSCSL